VSALGAFCLYLADSKQFLGIRYSEWCVSAPTLEASIAVTAMAQDELGHTRVLHGILGDLPDNPTASRDPENPASYRALPLLARRFASWEDLVAAALIADGFFTFLIRLGLNSSHDLFCTRMKKAYEEEKFHRLYAEGWAKWLKERTESAATYPAAFARTAGALSSHWEHVILPEILGSCEAQIPGIEFALTGFRKQLAPVVTLPEAGTREPSPPILPDDATLRLISGFYRKVYGVG
jgi:1,2-phenylacetyl-CoA epoxidase catalytic subunit